MGQKDKWQIVGSLLAGNLNKIELSNTRLRMSKRLISISKYHILPGLMQITIHVHLLLDKRF